MTAFAHGRLADDLFWLSLDDRTGRSLLPPAPLGIGIAAALFAELALHGSVTITGSEIHADVAPQQCAPAWQQENAHPRWPDNTAGQAVLHQLRAEHTVTGLDAWLQVVAVSAPDQVAYRMRADGLLRADRPRGFVLRRSVRHLPADPNVAAWPRARLGTALRDGRVLTVQDMILAALALAIGLGPNLLQAVPRSTTDSLHRFLRAPHGLPQLGALLARTQAAAGSAVLAYRI